MLGRTLRSIENFTDGVVAADANKTVSYTYSAAGMTSLSAHLIGGGVQTTAWLFGVSQGSGSTIDSNSVVGVTQWPDKSSGAASPTEEETTTINALGQTLTLTDRNGTTHELSYDVVGRLVSDEVTAFGTGVDQTVAKIEYGYDALGNTTLITSRDTLGAIVNQVQREFNGLGQMTAEWQEHGGAVSGSSQKVEYAWSEMPSGANHSRLVSITYPDGYVLTFNYASGINDDISRLSHLSDTGSTLEEYDYLGSGTVVRRAHPQPAVDMTLIGTPGAGGDQYAGLDEFGRVVDLLWEETTGPTALEHIQHSYDLLGNRLTRDNLVNSAFDEVYAYDDLSQLVNFARGAHTQDWDYDALGNWNSVTTNGGTPETRTHNAQNQITGISGATTPTFDANGNMTGDETGRGFVYDSWNRLVEVKNGSTVLKTYRYDGLNRRVSADDGTDVTDLYYSSAWQVLEERINGNVYAHYVWSPVYVDAMILRDRDTDSDGAPDERLWVIQDANWNVTALVDVNGNVVERYAYDPFGVRTVMDASWNVIGSSGFAFEHGFQGMVYDAISRSNKSRNRTDYWPTLGVWGMPDPSGLGPDANPYRFVGNNPIGYTDPSGLDRIEIASNTVYYLDTGPISGRIHSRTPIGEIYHDAAGSEFVRRMINGREYFVSIDKVRRTASDWGTTPNNWDAWFKENHREPASPSTAWLLANNAESTAPGTGVDTTFNGVFPALTDRMGVLLGCAEQAVSALKEGYIYGPLVFPLLAGVASFKHVWISRALYGELQGAAGASSKAKFVAAMKKGVVGPVGESGIKVLATPVRGYTHELKIGGSAGRLLGKVDKNGVLVFEEYVAGGLH